MTQSESKDSLTLDNCLDVLQNNKYKNLYTSFKGLVSISEIEEIKRQLNKRFCINSDDLMSILGCIVGDIQNKGNNQDIGHELKKIIVVEIRMEDVGGIKTKIHSWCSHYYISGYGEQREDKTENNNNNSNEPNTYAFFRFEGTKTAITQLLRNIQNELKLKYEKLQVKETSSCYSMFHIRNSLVLKNSWGEKSYGSISSGSSQSTHMTLRDQIFKRDNGICRFHGKYCPFSELGSIDTFKVGHLSSVGVNDLYHLPLIQKQSLTNCAINAYLWCRMAEYAWSKFLFSIDFETGLVIFSDEFPYDEMQIKRGTVIKITRWGEKVDPLRSFLEPPQWLIKKLHDIYVKERVILYQLYRSFEACCTLCGKGFAKRHSCVAHQKSHKIDPEFQSKTFYPKNEKVCDCKHCLLKTKFIGVTCGNCGKTYQKGNNHNCKKYQKN